MAERARPSTNPAENDVALGTCDKVKYLQYEQRALKIAGTDTLTPANWTVDAAGDTITITAATLDAKGAGWLHQAVPGLKGRITGDL